MVKVNNSFDGFNLPKDKGNEFSGLRASAADAYIRNLHFYRVGIELASLAAINYFLASREKVVIPALEFGALKNYFVQLAKTYQS